MAFNRINGFYIGRWSHKESSSMSLDERNDEVNQALEARFSQLNSALESQEARLKGMKITKETSVMYHEGYESWGQYQCFIGMVKVRGAWRLCHAIYCPETNEEYLEWKPIVEASVSERLSAATHIDKLRAEIVRVKEELIPEVETAISKLATLPD